jgi:hypothetical protein
VLIDLNVFISVMLANAVGKFRCFQLFFDMLMACSVWHRFEISRRSGNYLCLFQICILLILFCVCVVAFFLFLLDGQWWPSRLQSAGNQMTAVGSL